MMEVIMTLTLRGKTYFYRFWVNGKLYRGTTKKKDKLEAVAVEKEIKRKFKDGQSGVKILKTLKKKLVKVDIPINQVLSCFLENPNLPGQQQISHIKSNLDDFLSYLKFKKVKFTSEITFDHANAYIAYISKNGKFNKLIKYKKGDRVFSYQSKIISISKKTVSDYLINLKNVFNIIVQKGGILENPFGEIIIKGTKNDKESRKAFTPEELKLIGKNGKDSYLYPLFLTGISTGMREGDICKLKWENVCLRTGWIRNLKTSKTKKEVNIPILPGLKSFLQKLPNKTDDIYVFPKLQAIYKNNSTRIGQNVTSFLESIGIESSVYVEGRSRRVSSKDIHSLRHTFAYLAAIHNIPLPIVQSILGHMTPEMTKMYMDHAGMDVKQKMLSQMPNYLHAEEVKTHVSYEEIKDQLLKMNEHNWQEMRNSLLTELNEILENIV